MVSETIVLSFSGIILMGLTCFIAVDSFTNPASKIGLTMLFILGASSFGFAIADVIQWAARMKKGKNKDDGNNRN